MVGLLPKGPFRCVFFFFHSRILAHLSTETDLLLILLLLILRFLLLLLRILLFLLIILIPFSLRMDSHGFWFMNKKRNIIQLENTHNLLSQYMTQQKNMKPTDLIQLTNICLTLCYIALLFYYVTV